jgi:ribosomal protein S18 acetylase RimI-like enzyme
MELVTSYEQFLALTGGLPPRAATNFFMLPPQITHLIQAKSLYVQAQPNGLLFYEDFQSFYKLFFTLALGPSASGGGSVARCDKPVLTDIVDSERLPVSPLISSWLAENGFVRLAQYQQWKVSRAELLLSKGDLPEGYCFAAAQACHVPEILGLLQEAFSEPLAHDLPNAQQLAALAAAGGVVCVLSNSNKVLGALLVHGKNTQILGPLAISSAHRRLHLGRRLVEEYYRRCSASRFTGWFAPENIASQRLFESFGFRLAEKRLTKFLQDNNG